MEIKKVLFLFIIAILISLTLQKDLLEYRLMETPEKVAVPIQSNRTDLGDTYYYYITGKRLFNDTVLNLFSKPVEIEKRNSISDIGYVYSCSLLFSGLINYLSEIVTTNSKDAVLASLIIQGSIIIFLFIYAVFTYIGKEKKFNKLTVIYCGFLSTILLNWFLLTSFYGKHWFTINIHSHYPELFRIVNPQMGWIAGLFFIICINSILIKKSKINFYCLATLSFFMAFFSIGVTITLIGSLGLYLFVKYIVDKDINLEFIFVLLGLTISLILCKYQFNFFHNSSLGEELGTGKIISLNIKYHYFAFLLLIFPIWKFFKSDLKYWLSSLLFSSLVLGAICESIELGSRLWIRGSAIFVWLIIILISLSLISKVNNYLKQHLNKSYKYLVFFVNIIMLSSTPLLVKNLPKANPNNWHGYIEKEKWDMLNWLNHNTGSQDTILSSNLEDSSLIPIYTKANPFVNLYGCSQDNLELILKKYIFTLNYYNRAKEYINLINKYNQVDLDYFIKYVWDRMESELYPYVKYQTSAFYSMIIYYPYNKKMDMIFSSGKEKQQLISLLDHFQENSSENLFLYNIVIIDKRHDGYITNKKQEDVIYENSSYIVMKKIK